MQVAISDAQSRDETIRIENLDASTSHHGYFPLLGETTRSRRVGFERNDKRNSSTKRFWASARIIYRTVFVIFVLSRYFTTCKVGYAVIYTGYIIYRPVSWRIIPFSVSNRRRRATVTFAIFVFTFSRTQFPFLTRRCRTDFRDEHCRLQNKQREGRIVVESAWAALVGVEQRVVSAIVGKFASLLYIVTGREFFSVCYFRRVFARGYSGRANVERCVQCIQRKSRAEPSRRRDGNMTCARVWFLEVFKSFFLFWFIFLEWIAFPSVYSAAGLLL